MNDTRPDGEYFIDTAVKPIPHRNTWGSLSVNQLIETKNDLQQQQFNNRAHPVISKALQSALEELQRLIDHRVLQG